MSSNIKIKKLIDLFFVTSRLMKQRQDCQNNIDHVSWLQLHAISFIQDNSPTVSELSTFLKITRPSATSLVNNLVSRKYIKKIKEKNDARSSRLTILAGGKKFLKTGQAKIAANVKPVLAELSDAELSHFIAIHQHLQQICRKSL